LEEATTVGNAATLTIANRGIGTYFFYCRVADSAGSTQQSRCVKLVVAAPLTVSAVPATVFTKINQEAVVAVEVSGGTLPYTYTWIGEGCPFRLPSLDHSGILRIMSPLAGHFVLYCRVMDFNGVWRDTNPVTVDIT